FFVPHWPSSGNPQTADRGVSYFPRAVLGSFGIRGSSGIACWVPSPKRVPTGRGRRASLRTQWRGGSGATPWGMLLSDSRTLRAEPSVEPKLVKTRLDYRAAAGYK